MITRAWFRLTALPILVLASACGDDDTTPADTSGDTTADVTPDTTPDTSPDVLPDTSPDVLPDTTPDVVPDTSPDVVPDTTPDVLPDTVADTETVEPTTLTVFGDDYGAGITFVEFGGSTNAITLDTAEKRSGTSSLKIEVPAAGYTGGALVSDMDADLSGYSAVTFWAKASTANTLNVVGLANDADTTDLQVEWNGVALTTAWQRFIIPLPDASMLTAEPGLFHFAEGAEAAAYTIWLDDIQYETLGAGVVGAAMPAIATETVTREVGGTAVINGASVTYPVNGTNQTLSLARPYLDYSSSAQGVATVDDTGTVTAVAVGQAVITAKLGSIDAVGALTFNVTNAQVPATAAPTPTTAAADVISLFSNAYTNVAVDTWSAVWDNADVSDVTVAGNDTKKYSALVVGGIEFTTATVNATEMTHFRMDVWSPDATEFKVKLVDFGANGTYQGAPNDDTEHELVFNAASTPALATQQWVSIDVPLSRFAGLAARAHLAQIVLVSSNSTVYVDNVIFYKGAAAPTAPTAAAPGPIHGSANVISLFSNVYTNVPVDTWSTVWDNATVADAQVAGNDVKLYTNLVVAGIEFTAPTVNATAMTHFRFDVWTPDATLLRVKLVDFGANGIYQGAPNDDTEHELTFEATSSPALMTGQWQSFDIPLSSFTGLTARGHLAQLIFVSNNTTVYFDNVYFRN